MSTPDVAWLTPAALAGFAGSLAATARWLWAKFEKANEDRISDRDAMLASVKEEFAARLADQQAQTEHREALLEKVLVILQAHNEAAESTIALIKEIRAISGGRNRRPEGQS